MGRGRPDPLSSGVGPASSPISAPPGVAEMGLDPGPTPEEWLGVPSTAGCAWLPDERWTGRPHAGSALLLVNTVKDVSERTSRMSPVGTLDRAISSNTMNR